MLFVKKAKLSSKGIEPLTVFNQFFYREPPLPIGHLPPKYLNKYLFYILIEFNSLFLFNFNIYL